jgi:hypothetical protein
MEPGAAISRAGSLLIVVAIAGCDPTPPPSLAPSAQVVASPAPSLSTPTPGPTTEPMPTATAITYEPLPAAIASQAWARADLEAGTFSGGLLGAPAAFSRALPSGRADLVVAGGFVLVGWGERFELIAAADGETIAEIDLSGQGYAFSDPKLDPEGRFIYASQAAPSAFLHRIHADGGANVDVLFPLERPLDAPYWGGGFEINLDGVVAAVSCPFYIETPGIDPRCRWYHSQAGGQPWDGDTYLPKSTRPICGTDGASRHFLLTTVHEACGADGGRGTFEVMSVTLENRATNWVQGRRLLEVIGIVESGSPPSPVAIAHRAYEGFAADEFLRIAMTQDLTTGEVDPLVTSAAPGDVWSPVAIVGNHVLVELHSTGYMACRTENPIGSGVACHPDAGALWSVDERRLLYLADGTWGQGPEELLN